LPFTKVSKMFKIAEGSKPSREKSKMVL